MRIRLSHTAIAASAFLALSLLGSRARADQSTGFSLNGYDPSERGSDWFSTESLDLRGNFRSAFGLTGDFSYRPLVVYDSNNNYQSSIVNDQFTLHLGGSLVLWDRLRIGANLPLVLQQTGGSGIIDTVAFSAPTSSAAVGDLRLGADVRLLGQYGDVATVAVGARAYIPTGQREDYAGDGEFRLEPRAMIAGDVGVFTYAARVGVMIRGFDNDLGSPLGTQLTFGGSVGARLVDKKLTVGPEVWGGAKLGQNDPAFTATTTPLEGVIGAHYLIADMLRVGAGVGTGLTRGYGSPAFRGLLTVEWAPAYKEPDRDNDGIPDSQDACPDTPGVHTEDPKTNGCPPPPPPPPAPPSDRDHDGIPDSVDACPDVPGVATNDPKTNGCPADRDHDGIPDAEDACPDVAGVKNADPKKNGCPEDTDRDKDGIPNDLDACPDEPGPPNADPKKNGCPLATVKNHQIVINEQVKFATGSATILPESDQILEAVTQILRDHTEIDTVSVEGHTDNVGTPARNKALSSRRAASVVTWLVKHGIAKGRLSSIGYGQEKPIDSNETDAGRQNNRRVEFHIESGKAK